MTDSEAKVINSYDWVEWRSRKHNRVVAMAVDPTSEKRTGVRRAVNGSMISQDAVCANPETPKSTLCIHIILERAKKGEKKPKVTKPKKNEKKPTKSKKKPAQPKPKRVQVSISTDDGSITTLRSGLLSVVVDDEQVKVLPAASKGDEFELRVTSKSWGVYCNKKRVAFGRKK